MSSEKKPADILDAVCNVLKREDHFLITTHIRPDGDSLASVLVLGHVFESLGKKHWIVLDDPIPAKYRFLPGIETILQVQPSLPMNRHDVCVVMDSSTLNRIGSLCGLVQGCRMIINIDHHHSNEHFGHLNWVNGDESSTVEMVYAVLVRLGIPLTKDVATLVYAGIVCDTGCFRFPNTTDRSLEICGEMIRKGVSPKYIADKMFYQKNPDTLRALAHALGSMELYFNDTVGCIHIRKDDLEGLSEADTEGFVDYLQLVPGTKVNFFMREEAENRYRVSLRSKNNIPIDEVARVFGGGGHAQAAGCTIEGSVMDVRNRILEVLRRRLD